jgi:hypothetical protein
VNALGSFVDADELYYSFSYLSPKSSRRDVIGAMHNSLMDEFQKCLQPFELHAKSSTLPLPRRREAEYFAKLILDSSYVVKTHTHMVTLYRTLSNPQNNVNVVYVELIKFLDKVERTVNNHITHPDLAAIKVNINTELYILHKLFLAEAQMAMNHQFRETIFNIYQSRADLLTWKARLDQDLHSIPNKSSTPSSSSSSSSTSIAASLPASAMNAHLKIPMFVWLNDFINAMHSKMTLFFYKPLWRQERLTGQADMKALVQKLDVPYPFIIETFCQKTDCAFFCLILEAEGLTYSPDGYECPDPLETEPEPLTGMKLYPVIFSIPYIDEVPLPVSHAGTPAGLSPASSTASFSASSPQSQSSSHSGPTPSPDTHLLGEHVPSIVVLMQDHMEELNQLKPRPTSIYFSKKAPDPGITYVMFKVSQKVTAVAVYRRKIKTDDSTDTSLVELRGVLTMHLRNLRVFAKLVPKD